MRDINRDVIFYCTSFRQTQCFTDLDSVSTLNFPHRLASLIFGLLVVGVAPTSQAAQPDPYLRPAVVPAASDNQFTQARVELGKALFFDPRLSGSKWISCAKIVRNGGKSLGRSPYMPAWQGELADAQITDVLEYLSVVSSAEGRGQVVFKTNCILCHGVNGDGNGRAARLLNPPHANLTRSDKNDMYKEMIITMGGAAMGRSPRMPVWGQQLSRQEITDVVAYLRTILVIPPAATWGF